MARSSSTDPISKFLPAFKDMQVSVATPGADGKIIYTNVPAAKPIIVQDLLRHSAGSPIAEITKNEPVRAAYVEAKFSQPGIDEYISRDTTPAEQVERIAKAPLIRPAWHDVGKQYGRRFLGAFVRGCVRQAACRFLDERLFMPLKMG